MRVHLSSDSKCYDVYYSASSSLEYNEVWFRKSGSVRFGTVRYVTVRFGVVRFGTVRYGSVRLKSDLNC